MRLLLDAPPWPPANGTATRSECGTWSHAVISSLGARARGGVGRAPAFRVARCQTWTQVSHPRCPSTQDFGNRTVTFRIDHTPLHRIAVQFEWA